MNEIELFEIHCEIMDDIDKHNIKGYIELIDFYKEKEEFEKIKIIKNNHHHFYNYIISNNRVKKQRFNVYDYYKKKRSKN